METIPKRQTAKIASVNELLEGDYVVQEGWKPNYIQTKNRKLTRVNIVGIVIEKPNPYQFSLDDGTGSIIVNDFNQSKNTQNLKVGEAVLIIGRPRKSNDQTFIAAEIVQQHQIKETPLWLVNRKEELNEILNSEKIDDEYESVEVAELEEDMVEEKQEEKVVEENITAELTDEDIIEFIKKKDTGDGCQIEDIIDYFGQEADNTILTLIAMGEIYEIKPGKIKVLE